MKYYINDKMVNYEMFSYYLKKSIKSHFNFTLNDDELHGFYICYFNDMKYAGTEILFKDKMSYKIRVK